MRIPFESFEGMAPKIDPVGLAGGLCENAINAGFSSGMLGATHLDFSEITLSDLKTTLVGAGSFVAAGGIFYSHMADAWFIWSQGTVVKRGVDSLIAPQDIWSRIYFADQNGPRFMTSDQYTNNAVNVDRTSFRLGIPFPEWVPTADLNSETIPPEVEEEDVVRQRVVYFYTLVDDFGHEGPPSDPSNAVDVPVEYNFQVVVDIRLGTTSVTGRSFGTNARKYIYRSAQGTNIAAAQFVGEAPFTADTFADTLPIGQEGEVNPSAQWFEPPAEIKEISSVASNFLAGFFDNILCFSVPKLPHAWPLDYRFPIKYRIVTIMPTSNGLFVGTTGKPYWCFGSDPESAIPVEVDEDYACVSADSVVDVGGFVVYATHDGLVALDGQESVLLTDPMFSRILWQALGPESIKAFGYEGKYIFYSETTNEMYSVMPNDPRTLTKLVPSTYALGLFTDLQAMERSLRYDRTILAFHNLAAVQLLEVVNQYSGNTEWESKTQKTPMVKFNYARVRSTVFPVTLTVTAGTSTFTTVVQDENPFRIAFGHKAREWKIKVEFSGASGEVIRDVILAQSLGEFQDVP